eukprot:g3450.t1 g3450   contig12:2098874-2101171(-)
MSDPPMSFSDDEHSFDDNDGPPSDLDNEYGDVGNDNGVTKEHSMKPKNRHDFYRASIRRQNCCFGSSMVTLAGLFVAAYFVMGLSFTPSNIGIFGDESTMKGTTGEVGIDADNAETQEIIDTEITELEKAGKWGEHAKDKHSKINKNMKDLTKNRDSIGEKSWVEKKQWWAEHKDDLDEKTRTETRGSTQKQEERQKKKNDRGQQHGKDKEHKHGWGKQNTKADGTTEIDSIVDKLANHYNFTGTGSGKENFPGSDTLGNYFRGNGKGKWKDRQGVNEGAGAGKKARDQWKNKCKGRNAAKDASCNDVMVNKVEDIIKVKGKSGEDVAAAESNGDGAVEESVSTSDPVQEANTEESPVAKEAEEPAAKKIVQTVMSNMFTVMEQVIHDKSSFTQGISYGSDGMIYETTGLYGQSKLRMIDPSTFEILQSVDVESKYFGEGSTFYTDADGNERIIEITWREQTGFIYDSKTLEQLETFQYTTTAPNNEGWGITYDDAKKEFIGQLNELEWIDGLVCCNIWHSDEIICVDPVTGKSVREYDMSKLWPRSERGGGENVLNGIALGKDHVLITGKRWDRMYKITFPDWELF